MSAGDEKTRADGAPPVVNAGDRPTHADDGVDLTLIRWMLRLTPTERAEWLMRQNAAVLELRRAAGLR